MTVTFIAISGASGSGKTLFAKTIVDELSPSLPSNAISILHEDAYYKDRSDLPMDERASLNYDHPDAFDHSLLLDHLTQLKAGQSVDTPVYDYATHARSTEKVTVNSAKVFLVEGILLLHVQQLREFFDARIFVDAALDLCLTRRLRRDMEERGRSLDSVLSQYESTVRPMYFEFIEPSKKWADVIVPRGGKNRVAIELVKNKLMSLASSRED